MENDRILRDSYSEQRLIRKKIKGTPYACTNNSLLKKKSNISEERQMYNTVWIIHIIVKQYERYLL